LRIITILTAHFFDHYKTVPQIIWSDEDLRAVPQAELLNDLCRNRNDEAIAGLENFVFKYHVSTCNDGDITNNFCNLFI